MRRFLSIVLALGLVALTSCLAEPVTTTSSSSATRSGRLKVGTGLGERAPEVISEDIAGNVVRLSDLRGKIVVLDIWATWCGPCKEMIPDERQIVERFKGQPLVLVSISCDNNKETLIDFLAKERMPWTHWWNGGSGGIISDYNIKAFPTIFVLDADGVIRYRDVRGKHMENAVSFLLGELAAKN